MSSRAPRRNPRASGGGAYAPRALAAQKQSEESAHVGHRWLGARNRRFHNGDILRANWSLPALLNHPLAVIGSVLDNFKRINDGFGTRREMKSCSRSSPARTIAFARIDWVARSGGEEFVFVLPETDLAGASSAARRLRACRSRHIDVRRSARVDGQHGSHVIRDGARLATVSRRRTAAR